MIYLSQFLEFPNPSEADPDGLLAVGGDLSPERLLLAYNSGIFPWYEDGQPILWWSPDLRMVLYPEKLKVSKSLQKLIKREIYQVTFNKAFSEVIMNCSSIKREGQRGTWITKDMENAYIDLHKQGHAMSVEVWRDKKLVGGLYGIDLPQKKIFCGESMFSSESNASKVGFYYLVSELERKKYKLTDCQLYTAHLESLGAEEIPREEFLQILDN
jgi:leucyl/phenylalanyl-tRNA--protein transferase